MKHTLKRLLTLGLLFASLAFTPRATAATLNAGDIVVIGHNSDTAPESFTFMPLVDIPGGTVVQITDRPWTHPAPNAFGTSIISEGKFTWTPAATVPAGTLFQISRVSGAQNITFLNITTGASLAVTNTNNGGPTTGVMFYEGWTGPTTVLNANSDNVFIYQDADSNPFFLTGFMNSSTLGSPVILNATTGWHDTSTAAFGGSALPVALAGNQNGVNIGTAPHNDGEAGTYGLSLFNFMGAAPGTYFANVQYTGPTSATNRAGWLSRLMTGTNWSGTNGSAPPANTLGTTIGSFASFGATTTTVTSLNRVNPATTNLSTVNWTLTFAAANTGVSASNFSLSGAAATGASVGTPTTSNGGLTWNVPVTTGSTDGTLTLSLANATGTTPGVSTTLPFTTAGQDYTMDKTLPTVSIGAPSVSTIAAGAGSVTYAITYSDTNFASSSLTTPGITLNPTGTANGTVGLTGSGTSYTVTISSITGVGTLGITVGANSSLDTAGNANLASSASTTFAVTAPTSGVASVGSQASVNAANTLSFTVPAGNNRLLVVTASHADNAGLALSGVTFGASAMAQAVLSSDGGSSVDSIWTLPMGSSASSTTATITVTRNAGAGTKPCAFISAQTFVNVDQASPIQAVTSANAAKLTAVNAGSSLTITSSATDLVFDIFDLYATNNTLTSTPGGSQTVVSNSLPFDLVGTGAVTGYTGFGLYKTTTKLGTGATANVSWTSVAPGGAMLSAAISIKQAPAGGGTPTITVNPSSVALGTTTTGTASTPAQSFTVSGSNLTADIVVTAPTNVELSKDSGMTWLTSQTLTQSGGSVGSTTILARIPASAVATTTPVSVTGNITSASTGATTQNVSVTGTVNPIPVLTINPTSQTLAHLANTQIVLFTSNVAGTTYTWSNDNTSIGIGASGSGSAIAPFTATNFGSTPQTGTFTVTPTANGVQGVQKTFTITVNPPTPTVTLSTASLLATATTLTITGTNFDTTAANNTVAFTPAGAGTVTLATATSLTVSVSGLRGGALNAVVTTGAGNSGAAVQVATVAPVITLNTGDISTLGNQLTINGVGFDPTLFTNNSVVFSPAGTGSVAGSTAGSLNVTGITGLTPGALFAVATVNGVASSSVQVATVVPPPTPEIAVSGSGNNIADGSNLAAASTTNATDFGSTPVQGGVVEVTYTIANSGTAVLNLSGGPNFVSVTPSTDFSVTQQPAATVADSGGMTTFKIAFNPTTAATTNATVTFTNDDANEGSFDFVIKGAGTGPQTFDLVGHPVSNTPFDGGETYIYSAGPPPLVPVTFTLGGTPGDATTGSGAPDASGTASIGKFDLLKRGGFLGDNGMVVFPGELLIGSGTPAVTSSPNTFMGIWKDDGTGLKLLARSGDPAPEAGNAVFDILPTVPAINDSGEVTLLATLALGAGSPATTAANDTGLWSELGGTGLQILIRENDDIPGLPAGTKVGAFASGAYATAHTGVTTGEAAFAMTMKGASTDTAILRTSIVGASTTAVGVVARQNTLAPGTTQNFGSLNGSFTDSMRMDATGNLVFVALLTSPSREGIWYQPVGGAVTKVAVAGDTAPGTSGATFKNIKSPAIGSAGVITFRGFLNNDGDNAAGLLNDGIWRGTAGAIAPILRRGDSGYAGMPGGSKVGNVWHGWLNNANHGAWRAWLNVNGNGVASSTANGDVNAIFTDINGGVMEMAVKVGDAAPGISGATFASMDLPVVGSASATPSANEWVAFIGKVTGGGTTAGVDDQGIWRKTGAGAFQLVIRAGDSITTFEGPKTIQKVDFPGSGSTDRRWEQPVMDNTGRLLIYVQFIDGSSSQLLTP